MLRSRRLRVDSTIVASDTGYPTDGRDTIVVTHGTPPPARGTALGITISGKGHRRRFDEAWTRSNGHVTFLGDWHMHPGGPAIPSRTDLRAMRQLRMTATTARPNR